MKNHMIYNCPNCGAPIQDTICPYCGTIIFDFVNLEVGKTAYIRMKINNSLCVCQAILTNISIEQTMMDTFYADTIVNLELSLSHDENGNILKLYTEK